MSSKLKAKILLGVMSLTPVLNCGIMSDVSAIGRVNRGQNFPNRFRRESRPNRAVLLGQALIGAWSDGNVDEIRDLLRHGANFTTLGMEICRDILSWAVIKGYGDVVIAILNSREGILGDGLDAYAGGLLCLAVGSNYTQIVNGLLAHGANVNVTMEDGVTPLHLAASNGNLDIVNALLRYGANPNVLDDHRFTPLHMAVLENHTSVVGSLLQSGRVDVTIRGEDNMTALEMARINGNYYMTHLLENRSSTC